ncbi:MAG: CbiX/SirB N-terminal domain-containing protein, partial [Planctomycetota bacterium]|nr:CbiX/SirB N-terminal domain-containing protein [Planctomycetota bacterium]
AVEPLLLEHPRIDGVRTAFMEYTEPSIATQLEAFDAEGYDEVVLVPILLTVSSHSFDDIPTILGAKDDLATREGLASEGIRTYTPRAKVSTAPLLDFAAVMRENLRRRVAALSTGSTSEGVVLVAYGSTPFDAEWTEFLEDMGRELSDELGVDTVEHAWCGHIVSYSPEPTADAIARVLEREQHALVVPVLVAVDEDFQYSMILEAAEREYAGGEVHYVPDSILPEPLVEDWAVRIAKELADQ